MNNSLETTESIFLNIPKEFVVLTAALWQCKEGFKDEFIHIPKSFQSHLANSIEELD